VGERGGGGRGGRGEGGAGARRRSKVDGITGQGMSAHAIIRVGWKYLRGYILQTTYTGRPYPANTSLISCTRTLSLSHVGLRENTWKHHTPSSEDPGTVTRIVDTGDGIIVADKRFNFVAIGHVPQAQGLIVGSRRQHGAIGRKAQVSHLCVFIKCVQTHDNCM
jgi:hypothetical protein